MSHAVLANFTTAKLRIAQAIGGIFAMIIPPYLGYFN